MDIKSELRKKYNSSIKSELQKELNLENVMSVPNLEKIIVNSGVGEAKTNQDLINQMVSNMTLITGQKPVVTKTKKAISNFKIREGMPIGVKVTLRDEMMWFFIEKLIHIVLPRIKDFRGVPLKSFDGRGNYSLGFKEQLVFPEIDTSVVTTPIGLQVVICTTAKDDESSKLLLTKLGMPFEKK